MKRVSFEVAKALAETGYPQKCDVYYPVPPKYQYIARKIAQPTYLEVWLWLSREKDLRIFPINVNRCFIQNKSASYSYDFECTDDPEEAIISAIKYLIENNLIK